MRINAHAHIFNLQSVFTDHTLRILIARLVDWALPAVVHKAVVGQLRRVIGDAGKQVDPEDVVARITKAVLEAPGGRRLLAEIQDETGAKIGGLDDVIGMAAEKLWDLVKRLSRRLADEEGDAASATLVDVLQFVRIALLPDIRSVTRVVMDQMPADSALVALTMDITNDGDRPDLFERQLQNTSDMVLAYPGRILPFYAANPRRPDTFDRLQRAVAGLGFVGVKLYPSLGHPIDGPDIRRIYTFCENGEIPLLMHCNRGGFKWSDEWAKQSDPSLWGPILKDHPRLKICFGHFGGDESIAADPLTEKPWQPAILGLMEKYPGVYADISYHTEAMKSPEKAAVYFRRLRQWLGDARYRDRILFGTDYFLVRQRLEERSYWKFFAKRLSPAEFDRLTVTNPASFLRMPAGPGQRPGKALANYVRFLARERDHVETEPARWVTAALRALGEGAVVFRPMMAGLRWDANSSIHMGIWKAFRDLMIHPEPFDRSAAVAIRDMRYWVELRVMEERQREIRLRSVARRVEAAMREAGARPAVGTGQVRERILKAVSDGATLMADLAALCDEIYKR